MPHKDVKTTDALFDYIESVSLREPKVLRDLRDETASMKGAGMQISAIQGQFMATLVRLMAARRILEIGTFTGYSSTVMAMALPIDGEMICLDTDAETTAVAKKYWKKAGVADRITLRLGQATESLKEMLEDEATHGTFDLVFIDADKKNNPIYYECALRLLRPGGVVIVDNVLLTGGIVPSTTRKNVGEVYPRADTEEKADEVMEWLEAVRNFNRHVHQDDRVHLSMIPVGDGLTLAVKK